MTSVNEMNAVTRDRARIRESIGTLKTLTKKIHSTVVGSPRYREEVWVRRGDVLALLTDNVMQPYKVPVHCGCCPGSAKHEAVEEPILPKTGRFNGQLEDGTPISIGYKVLEKDEVGDLKNVELLEVSLEKKQLVILDFCDGKVYVYPYPELVVHSDIEDWIADETEHDVSSCEWMVTSEPFEVKV